VLRCLLFGSAILALWPISQISAATFVVTTTADTPGNTCTSTCSLRQAIGAANLQPGADEILFNIPGTGPHTIATIDWLEITDSVLIDGYSQPGSSPNTRTDASNDAVLKVQVLPGTLLLCGDNSEIRGLSLPAPGANAGIVVGFLCPGAGSGSRIVGNFFGMAPDGTRSYGNIGIEVYGTNNLQIGGELPAERNLFANSQFGIALSSDLQGSSVLNNLFGTDASGTVSYGIVNAVTLWNANGITIGSDTAPNVFRFNSRAITSYADSTGNTYFANHVADSNYIGIDILGDGPTPNDPDDIDDGPNELQNYPVLQSAQVTANGITVSGTLDVPAATSSTSYRIALYESEACNASGWGEGERYLGSQELIFSGTPATAEEFAFNLVTTPPIPGNVITATATNPNGSTSEFSACLEVVPPPAGEIFGNGFED